LYTLFLYIIFDEQRSRWVYPIVKD